MTSDFYYVKGFKVEGGKTSVGTCTFLKSKLSMNLTHIFLTWKCEILSFYDSSVYVLALNLSHLFFMLYSQELTYELWVYGDYLY